MARIIISICGEGRGHASRAISLVERLHTRHKLLLVSFGEGYDFLLDYKKSTNSEISICRIEGIKYLYDKQGCLAPLKTYLYWAQFIFLKIRRQCKRVDDIVLSFKPDLAIVDFEPCLPRVAFRRKIPCISIDHQHFIRFCDNDILPFVLRIRAIIGGWVCRLYVPIADLYIITAFFKPKLRNNPRQTPRIIGSIIRDDIKGVDIWDDGIIVSYIRKSMPDNLKIALISCRRPVLVYGLGKQSAIENIRFKEIDRTEFVKDLARATAVIGAAGNQIIGESLFLCKPFYALPERNHHEQIMNSYYLRDTGRGCFTFIEDVRPSDILNFLESKNEFMGLMMSSKGTSNAMDDLENILEEFISRKSSHTI